MRRSARAGSCLRGDRRGDRHRRLRALFHGDERRRRDPGARSSPTSARATRSSARGRGAVATRRARSAATARLAEPRAAALDLRALRPPRRLAHGAPPRVRRRRPAAAPLAARARRLARRAGRPASLDPRTAGALAVLEAARNVACAGGEPLGLTDCLNFGNPEKPEIALGARARRSRASPQAAEALGIPVVSGNVSLYNETDGRRSRRRPSSAASASSRDVRAVPARWREGDVVCSRRCARRPRDALGARRPRSIARCALAVRAAPLSRSRTTAPGRARGGASPRPPPGAGSAPSSTSDDAGCSARPARASSSAGRTPAGDRRCEIGVAARSSLASSATVSTSDVRRLRHPGARARRRAAHATSACTRCSTAARSPRGSPSPSAAG